MHEFNTRISAQREILRKVNIRGWEKENLLGLSRKAIDRWIMINRIDHSELVELLTTAGAKLFFLANKSQEQITEEYRQVSAEIAALAEAIERALERSPTPGWA